MQLKVFAFFHLNLLFSSIEEELRPQVISRCYWPLLRMVRELKIPVGIEISGCSLEVVQELDPEWVRELADLCREGLVCLIGSGYAQLIGPLVPARVNEANQRFGLETYRSLLGFHPELVLVNEQAFSAGMVPHYLNAGYRGMIMEWDNPSTCHSDWDPAWRYLPQYACGPAGEKIALIWNKSIPFQQFQRYAHGELELQEYLQFLEQHLGEGQRVFSLYGNDAEIFNFRPGRFSTESSMQTDEWQRLSQLFAMLQLDSRFQLIAPLEALNFLDVPGAGNSLTLQSAAMPVPVKKQAKYNITRWAVTGRDDLRINSICHRIYRGLVANQGDEKVWRELCYLWSSDFRTHITEKRWEKYQQQLTAALERQNHLGPEEVLPVQPLDNADLFNVSRNGRFLEIATPAQQLRLNVRRGLTIDRLIAVDNPDVPLIGTLPHGFYDEISLGADFYTGHLVAEIPGEHKVTDLAEVDPVLTREGENLVVSGIISTTLGPIEKRVIIPSAGVGLSFQYRLNWDKLPPAALRMGFITLHPLAFDRESLFFRTHNGGNSLETFFLNAQPIDHLAPASTLVSASQGMGATEGLVELGDSNRSIRIEFNPAQAALTGHILFRPSKDSYLFRLIFSAREIDDTSRTLKNCRPSLPEIFSFQLSVH